MVWEGAEVAVAPAVVAVGAGPPVVAERLVEVAGREGAEVVVDLDWVVAVAEGLALAAYRLAPSRPRCSRCRRAGAGPRCTG